MKIHWILVCAIGLLALATLAGPVAGGSGPILLWNTTIGGTGNYAPSDILEAADGSFLIVGNSTSANGTAQAFIIRLDANGTKLWEKTYGGTGVDSLTGIMPAGNDSFALVGWTGTGIKQRFLVMKVDANGTPIFEANFTGKGYAKGYEMIPTADGGFLAVGKSAASLLQPADIYVVRVDRTGRLVWEKSYGGAGEDFASGIAPTADGGFAITGAMVPEGQQIADAFLLKIDASGNRAWEKYYGANGRFEAGLQVIRMDDNGFMLVGQTSAGPGIRSQLATADIYLVRTDKDGVKLWDRTIGGAGFDQARDVEKMADGGSLIFGTRSTGDKTGDFYLFKISKDGTTIWQSNFTSSTGNEIGNALHPVKGGGYILVGSKDIIGAGRQDLWVMRLAAEEATNVTGTAPAGNATGNMTVTVSAIPPAANVTGTLAGGTTAATAPATTKAPIGLPAVFAALAGISLLAARRR